MLDDLVFREEKRQPIPYKIQIDLVGVDIYINFMKLNFIQRFILRLLGIRIKKYNGSDKE